MLQVRISARRLRDLTQPFDRPSQRTRRGCWSKPGGALHVTGRLVRIPVPEGICCGGPRIAVFARMKHGHMKHLTATFVFLVGCLSVSGQARKEDIPLTQSLSGAEMYKTWCASCHGIDGKGGGPAASALKTPPADLTLLSKKNGGKFPTERVRSYIDGTGSKIAAHGSREMPVWGIVLRQVDASAPGISYRVVTLSSYLESLQVK
jgi:mono/diheme cytochrome c family protein